jgi:hypothetical protein
MSNQKRRAIGDVISVPLSILAFLLSVTTTYITVIRQTDDVRAVIGDAPYIFVDDEGRTAVLGGQQMTIANAGNRSAAVIGVRLVLVKRESEEPLKSHSECATGNMLTMVYKIEKDVVTKPGEITERTLTSVDVELDDHWEQHDSDAAWTYSASHFKAGDTALVCLQVSVVTPSDYLVVVNIPKYFTKVPPIGGQLRPSRLMSTKRPVSLVRKARTLFTE